MSSKVNDVFQSFNGNSTENVCCNSENSFQPENSIFCPVIFGPGAWEVDGSIMNEVCENLTSSEIQPNNILKDGLIFEGNGQKTNCTCYICELEFCNITEYYDHLEIHMFTCFCTVKFQEIADLWCHIMSSPQCLLSYKMSCVKFDEIEDLYHYELEKLLNLAFISKVSLKQKNLCCTNGQPHHCHICGETLYSSILFIKHEISHDLSEIWLKHLAKRSITYSMGYKVYEMEKKVIEKTWNSWFRIEDVEIKSKILKRDKKAVTNKEDIGNEFWKTSLGIVDYEPVWFHSLLKILKTFVGDVSLFHWMHQFCTLMKTESPCPLTRERNLLQPKVVLERLSLPSAKKRKRETNDKSELKEAQVVLHRIDKEDAPQMDNDLLKWWKKHFDEESLPAWAWSLINSLWKRNGLSEKEKADKMAQIRDLLIASKNSGGYNNGSSVLLKRLNRRSTRTRKLET